jgi:plasmid stabilization system protein ParE
MQHRLRTLGRGTVQKGSSQIETLVNRAALAVFQRRRYAMPRGDKSSYTTKQKRQARHIEEGYEDRGVSEKEAARRAWATVNKETGGGKKRGSGRGKPVSHASARKGGRIGGRAAASRPAAARSRSVKKAARKRR